MSKRKKLTLKQWALKEKYLAVASPECWDMWLSYIADAYAVEGNPYNENYWPFFSKCFFCHTFRHENGYVGNCSTCMPNEESYTCLGISFEDKVDRAIARLEAVNLWDE